MDMELIPNTVLVAVCRALNNGEFKSATKYLGSRLVVKATWRHRPSKSHRHEEIVLTYGEPNFRETKFIEACFKAGENLPVRKVQLSPWPKQRARKP
jgi:hypothetical protein